MFVSQPLPTLLSQFPNPLLHTMVQVPPEQDGLPLFELHPALHPPQCVVLVFRFVSQPLAALLSQLPHPELQTMPHVPPEQVAVPFVESQALLQAPHASGLLPVTVSQPFATLLSQFP